MKINQDTQQYFKFFTSSAILLYKIVMASFLSVVVPQKCGDHMCSYDENVKDLDEYNKFVLSFNLITGIVFVFFTIYESYREYYFIENFDIDPNYSDNNLENVLGEYNDIKNNLLKINKNYRILSIILGNIVVLNLIFSGILVFQQYYYDFKTVTVFFSNFLLVLDKISTSIAVSSDYEKLRAKSYYQTEHSSFNVIDSDKIKNNI
jgi:hypothetical protein